MDLVRGMNVVKAEALLNNLSKRPCLYIKRVLKSAVDSADKLFHIPASGLYISLIKADQGPLIKRFRAASMGRASEFLHRTSHIIIELDKIKVPEKKVIVESEKTEKKIAKKTEGTADDMAVAMQSSAIYTFPLMTLFIGIRFASGLALYWLLFSLYQMVQQYRSTGWGGLTPWLKKLNLII